MHQHHHEHGHKRPKGRVDGTDILLSAFMVSAIGGLAVFGLAELNQWWTPEIRLAGMIGYEALDFTAFVLIGNAMSRPSRRSSRHTH